MTLFTNQPTKIEIELKKIRKGHWTNTNPHIPQCLDTMRKQFGLDLPWQFSILMLLSHLFNQWNNKKRHWQTASMFVLTRKVLPNSVYGSILNNQQIQCLFILCFCCEHSKKLFPVLLPLLCSLPTFEQMTNFQIADFSFSLNWLLCISRHYSSTCFFFTFFLFFFLFFFFFFLKKKCSKVKAYNGLL